MNIAVISDIHGNLFALDAIIGDIRQRQVERILCLGDVAAGGPQPREALRRLQSEGFVEISPRRTTIAAGVDLNDLAHIYDLRRIIELEIGRRSVSHMTKNDIEAVRQALASFQAVANDPSSAEFWERHREFHWALLAPAANATVKRVLDHLWQSSERYVRLFVSTFATMDTVMDLHVELYEACAGGDVTTFENALTRHYVETEQTVRDGFRSLQVGQAEATNSF